MTIDHDAERNSAWCDACGVHHGGECACQWCGHRACTCDVQDYIAETLDGPS
jgi:hypothetical protein